MTSIKIYKITNSVSDMTYIGSTKTELKKRFCKHRSEAKLGKKRLLCKYMNEIGIDNFSIHLIREVIVQNSKTAKIQEQIELWSIPKEKRLNLFSPHSHIKDRSKRRPEYIEKHRERVRKYQSIKIKDKAWRDEKNRKKREHTKKMMNDPIWLENKRRIDREGAKRRREKLKQDTPSQTERVCAQA